MQLLKHSCEAQVAWAAHRSWRVARATRTRGVWVTGCHKCVYLVGVNVPLAHTGIAVAPSSRAGIKTQVHRVLGPRVQLEWLHGGGAAARRVLFCWFDALALLVQITTRMAAPRPRPPRPRPPRRPPRRSHRRPPPSPRRPPPSPRHRWPSLPSEHHPAGPF